MYELKQSTAINLPFFAMDSSGDAVTGLTDGTFTAKRISKAGGAFSTIAGTITELEGGWYLLPLTAVDTATIGILSIYLTHASIKQVNLQFRVETRLGDDLAYPSTSGRAMDVSTTGAVGVDFNNVEGTLAKTTHITGFNDLSAAQVNAEVDSALNTAIPGSPVADSVNERLATMDAAYTATRAGYLDELAAANLPADVAAVLAAIPSAQDIEDEILDAQTSLHTDAGSVGEEIQSHALSSEITALNDLSAAEVNAEVVDALATDTYAEPGSGAPAATLSLAAKIGFVYKQWRNRKTVTASQESLYDDAGTTVEQKALLSDNSSTFEKSEVIGGP